MEYDFTRGLIRAREQLDEAQLGLRFARLRGCSSIPFWEAQVGLALDVLWLSQIACCGALVAVVGLEGVRDAVTKP